MAEVEAALERVQTLDPIGIGARNPGECIAIQLRALTPNEPGRDLAIRVATEHLDMVAQQDYANLRRQLGCQMQTWTSRCGPDPRLPSTTWFNDTSQYRAVRGTRCIRA